MAITAIGKWGAALDGLPTSWTWWLHCCSCLAGTVLLPVLHSRTGDALRRSSAQGAASRGLSLRARARVGVGHSAWRSFSLGWHRAARRVGGRLLLPVPILVPVPGLPRARQRSHALQEAGLCRLSLAVCPSVPPKVPPSLWSF